MMPEQAQAEEYQQGDQSVAGGQFPGQAVLLAEVVFAGVRFRGGGGRLIPFKSGGGQHFLFHGIRFAQSLREAEGDLLAYRRVADSAGFVAALVFGDQGDAVAGRPGFPGQRQVDVE